MQNQSYASWYFYQVAIRCYKNDMEHLVTFLPLSLVNGICFPLTSSALLATYLGSRLAFTIGYQEKEGAFNEMRMYGSLGVNLSKMIAFGLTFWMAIQMIRGRLILQQALRIL